MAKLNVNNYLLKDNDSVVFNAEKSALNFFVFSKNSRMKLNVLNSLTSNGPIDLTDITIHCGKNFYFKVDCEENQIENLAQKIDYESLFKNIVALDSIEEKKTIFTPRNKYKIQETLLSENIENILQTKEEKMSPELIVGEDALQNAIEKTAEYARIDQLRHREETDEIVYDI